MGAHAEIMDIAINEFLGSEKHWCTGSFARDADGKMCGTSSAKAVSHCAEGALDAAFYRWADGAEFTKAAGFEINEVRKGVEAILIRENSDFVEKVMKASGDCGGQLRAHGHNLPLFNDGYVRFITDEDGEMVDDYTVIVPGVGYAGIRAAFEKYYIECQEKDL